jgi:hypothetical protein
MNIGMFLLNFSLDWNDEKPVHPDFTNGSGGDPFFAR